MKIGEQLTGRSMNTYIPIEKREYKRATHDGELRRAEILNWIKQHEGEKIDQTKLGNLFGVHSTNVSYHLKRLKLEGRVRSEGRRWWSGRTPVVPPKGDGPVVIKNPPAKVSASALENVEAEAWRFVKSIAGLPEAELGLQIKGVVGLVEHMRKQLPGAVPDQPEAQNE